MKFSDVRWLLRATYANCLLTLLVIFTRSSESSQFKKKINGIDCTDDASVCESNGKCLTLDQERWSTLNASQKSICRCTHNWHGDYCSVCMGRFSLVFFLFECFVFHFLAQLSKISVWNLKLVSLWMAKGITRPILTVHGC